MGKTEGHEATGASKPYFLVTVLFAVWAIAFAYSFVTVAVSPAEGSGFTRGANRIATFLGWQGIAGLLALCIFGVARAWTPGSSVRRLAAVPLGLAAALIAVFLGVAGWAALRV